MDKLERKLERARSGESSGRASDALATFELTRPIVGASAIGIAQAAYEWTLEYLLEDAQILDPIEEFLDESSTAGRPPLERQHVQQVLADVATEIEAARMLCQRASWMGRNGIPMSGGQGSMSKLKAGDTTMWATTTLMDLVGPAAASLTAREVVPRRQDLPAVRGHGPGPAPRRLADAGRRVPRAPRAGAGRARQRRARPPASPSRRSPDRQRQGRAGAARLQARLRSAKPVAAGRKKH